MMRVIGPSMLALAVVCGVRAGAAEPFRFVALPDTQVYSENRMPDDRFPPVTDPNGTGYIFGAQTQWIADNADAMNIRYVGHLGDIVQNGENLTEWALAKDAMNTLLDAGIPHGTVMGNHDDIETPDLDHGETYISNYLDNFGPQVFAGQPWYTDSSPSGGGNFQLLQHGDQPIGFINFSIDQPQSEIDWASDIIESNPGAMFVLGTHRYMFDFKLIAGRYDEEVNVTPLGTFRINNDGPAPGVVDPNFGQELYEQIVAPNHNVLMIHSGHFHSEWLRVNDLNTVQEHAIEMLTDYQDARNGGDGWMRIYSIDLENSTFTWDTYSPTLDEYRSTLHHFVETIQQAYVQRDQVKQLLGFPNDETYFAWLDQNLKDNPQVPDGFLAQHPDWDADYFNDYLADMFNVSNGGTIPAGFDNILEWENLWMLAFAADPSNPFDFSPSHRSPSGSLAMNYNAFIPEPASIALLGLGGLALLRRRR